MQFVWTQYWQVYIVGSYLQKETPLEDSGFGLSFDGHLLMGEWCNLRAKGILEIL